MSAFPRARRPESSQVKRNHGGELVSVNAVLNYQVDAVERSLLANGKCYSTRDKNGSDSELVGVNWSFTEVMMHNARHEQMMLDRNGFEFRDSRTCMTYADFKQEDSILRRYYPECAELIKQVTGATFVAAFDHNIRSATGKEAGKSIEGGSAVQPPATLVHGDYTLTSGPRRLEQLGQPPKVNDTLGKLIGGPVVSEEMMQMAKRGRFAIVNVWRNIRDTPVESFPLACCDSTSSTADDLCVFEIHYADRIGENYFAAHSPTHKWYYYPHMVRNEALFLKQWDSHGTLTAGDKSPFTLHTAFVDPTTPEGATDRESIEVRCICIFEATQADGGAP